MCEPVSFLGNSFLVLFHPHFPIYYIIALTSLCYFSQAFRAAALAPAEKKLRHAEEAIEELLSGAYARSSICYVSAFLIKYYISSVDRQRAQEFEKALNTAEASLKERKTLLVRAINVVPTVLRQLGTEYRRAKSLCRAH